MKNADKEKIRRKKVKKLTIFINKNTVVLGVSENL